MKGSELTPGKVRYSASVVATGISDDRKALTPFADMTDLQFVDAKPRNKAGSVKAGSYGRRCAGRRARHPGRESGPLPVVEFTASRWRASEGACPCCGRRSSLAWGGVSSTDAVCAVYFVHWHDAAPDHPAHVDLIVGPWGQDDCVVERRLLALRYLPQPGGGELIVIDGASRPAAAPPLCAHALTADTLAAAADADRIQAMVAALWMSEPAIAELRALDALTVPQASL